MLGAAVAMLFLSALGCVAPVTAPVVRPPTSAEVVIERAAADGGWEATWYLAEPTRGLRFERPAAQFRGRIFEVLTPGFRMEEDGEFEVLRTEGPPVDEIRVRFPEYDPELSREYEFFRRFSDGGIAIYTGHLVARPASGEVAGSFVRKFRFVPPAGMAIIVGGERHNGSAQWEDTIGRGTYVYIGDANPVHSPDVISILDEGLPEWIRDRTGDALPRLYALYRSRLGTKPQTRPVVLFDYKEGDDSGYSYGGGTLPGLIQLGIEGAAWNTESDEALLHLLHFLGHEAAHVWNGEIAYYVGSEDAWMHEGGADALTERALVELGVIDGARLLEYQTAALNECRTGLMATPLRTSAQNGKPRLAYSCGNVIALLTESVLRPVGTTLWDFWRALIARAGEHDSEYGVDDYLAVWRALGASDQRVAALEQVVQGTADPGLLTELLSGAGVALGEASPPRSYAETRARDAISALMAADCQGRVGFRMTRGGFAVDQDLPCVTIVPGDTIIEVGGYDVRQDGHLAYDVAQRACQEGRVVRLTLRSGASSGSERVSGIEVECDGVVPERPAYLRISSYE